jgi:peptide-methionine (R)-S-oxide reductase
LKVTNCILRSSPPYLDDITFLQVRCGKCNNGLGHEFLGGGPTEDMSRFWIFSESLRFISLQGKA